MMEEHSGGGFVRRYLIFNLVLTGVILIGVAWMIWETNRWLSFAGFAALFLLMLLVPLFLIQQAAVVLLTLTLRRRRRWMLITASVLQILGVLPLLALAWAIEDYRVWIPLAAQLLTSAAGLVVQHWVR